MRRPIRWLQDRRPRTRSRSHERPVAHRRATRHNSPAGPPKQFPLDRWEIPGDARTLVAMSKALRQIGDGSMGGFGQIEVPEGDRAKIELLDLGEAGFRIFRPRDLDHTHDPWLVAKDDDSIWTLESGMPLSGYRPNTNAVLVGKNNSWAYLTAASASSMSNKPRDRAEVERRARDAEAQAERQRAEHERNLVALRAAAVPVTTGDLDPAMRMTLAQAGERIDQAGGRIEVDHGRLIVCLPAGAGTFGTGPLDAAKVLYAGESAVVALLMKGEALPDAPITPAGAVIAS